MGAEFDFPNPELTVDFGRFLCIAILFLEAVYLLLAFVQTRQIKLMNASFITPHAWFFSVLGKINLIGAILIFLISLSVLL